VKYKSWIVISIALLPLTVILTQCLGPTARNDPRGDAYAGGQTCKACHQEVYRAYFNSWHSNSSRYASLHSIHGSLKPGQNSFTFADHSEVRVEDLHGKLYQSAYQNGKLYKRRPIDLVFGGKKAETYLNWEGNGLFELPLSYFNGLNSWTNDPGYLADKPNFSRAIVKRCFECHSSYISEAKPSGQSLAQQAEFEKASLINGIDCERCHGPAAKHVAFHIQNPKIRKANLITSFASLSRSQKLDACAVCHSGNKDTYLTTTFNFKIGDTLANFKEPGFTRRSAPKAKLDVHGNQYGLLITSKCFIMSKMDCTTCHDAHSSKKISLSTYSQKCISCHQQLEKAHLSLTPHQQLTLTKNCIDCHMPNQPSEVIHINSVTNKTLVPYLIRNHLINIYR
jgi:predicted CXXCH cytochrome family protein